jgi:hypothetical protein
VPGDHKRDGAPTTETPPQQVPPGTAAIVPDAGDPRRIGELLGDWLAIQMDTVDSLVAEAESKVAVLPDQRHSGCCWARPWSGCTAWSWRSPSCGKGPGDDLSPDADKLLATLRTGAWLDTQEFPPLSYAVPGLIPEGSVLLVGAPKIGKSWLVLAVALAVAEGGRALGLEVPKRPVLYLALEGGHRRLQDRCRRLLVGEKIPPEFPYLTMIEPGRVNDTIAAWIHWHQEPPPLVILDTLGKILPPTQLGEDRYQRDYRMGTALKRIVDGLPGMTLLVNHHDRKANADDFVDAVSGTHGLAGAADTIIVLARDRQEAAGLLRSPAGTWPRASMRSPSRTGPYGS